MTADPEFPPEHDTGTRLVVFVTSGAVGPPTEACAWVWHPYASVTVTVHVPDGNEVAEAVDWGGTLFQE